LVKYTRPEKGPSPGDHTEGAISEFALEFCNKIFVFMVLFHLGNAGSKISHGISKAFMLNREWLFNQTEEIQGMGLEGLVATNLMVPVTARAVGGCDGAMPIIASLGIVGTNGMDSNFFSIRNMLGLTAP
jgi:hypothetical protein